jgi:hypothetical protein
MNCDEVAPSVRAAYRLLLSRCQDEGIPVALVTVPISPIVQGFVSAKARRSCADYLHELMREQGVAVLVGPDWLEDDDFADGQHLLPPAAAKYSRWLADTHLKPWLAERGGRPR